MHENDGEREERELVLGTKQLLGIFFVGTLLCGVFFAMGYVVGGNSAKAGVAAAATDGAPATATDDGKREQPRPPSSTDSATASAPTSGDSGSSVPAAEPRLADNPAAAGAQPSGTLTAAAAPQTIKSATPAPVSAAAAVYISVPEKGTSYWQVTATGRPTADVLVRSLRERQLPAILAESSKPELYRVLVGPYRSAPALAEAKRKLLELGGFDSPILEKY